MSASYLSSWLRGTRYAVSDIYKNASCLSSWLRGTRYAVSDIYVRVQVVLIGSLSTRVFRTGTAIGSGLFSLLTRPRTTTFTLPSIFPPLEKGSIKIWETIRS